MAHRLNLRKESSEVFFITADEENEADTRRREETVSVRAIQDILRRMRIAVDCYLDKLENALHNADLHRVKGDFIDAYIALRSRLVMHGKSFLPEEMKRWTQTQETPPPPADQQSASVASRGRSTVRAREREGEGRAREKVLGTQAADKHLVKTLLEGREAQEYYCLDLNSRITVYEEDLFWISPTASLRRDLDVFIEETAEEMDLASKTKKRLKMTVPAGAFTLINPNGMVLREIMYLSKLREEHPDLLEDYKDYRERKALTRVPKDFDYWKPQSIFPKEHEMTQTGRSRIRHPAGSSRKVQFRVPQSQALTPILPHASSLKPHALNHQPRKTFPRPVPTSTAACKLPYSKAANRATATFIPVNVRIPMAAPGNHCGNSTGTIAARSRAAKPGRLPALAPAAQPSWPAVRVSTENSPSRPDPASSLLPVRPTAPRCLQPSSSSVPPGTLCEAMHHCPRLLAPHSRADKKDTVLENSLPPANDKRGH